MINFDKDTHTYTLENKTLISVTQLMSRFGLAPDYKGVSSEVLSKAAEYGTLVHKELEDYIKYGEQGFSFELNSFIRYLKKNSQITDLKSETIVHDENVAGTVDLIYKDGENIVIADFKTTFKVHKDAVAWQLSIYAYLYLQEDYNLAKIKVFHFNPELKVIELPLKPKKAVKKLFDAYKSGFQITDFSNINLLPTTLQEQINEVETAFVCMEAQYNALKKRREMILEKVQEVMEENGVSQIETDFCKISITSGYTKETIDTKRLKADYPEIAEKYSKITNTKASLRIKIKEKENE